MQQIIFFFQCTCKFALKFHVNAEHKKYKMFCKICGVSFTRLASLNIHIKSVHENKKNVHKCNLCDKSFPRTDKLKIHVKSVHEKIKYPCDICHKLFSRKDKVTRHKRRVHEKSNA